MIGTQRKPTQDGYMYHGTPINKYEQASVKALTELDKLETLERTRQHLGEHGLEHFSDGLAPRRIHVRPQLPHDAAQESDVLGVGHVDPVLGQAGQGVGRSLGGAGGLLRSRPAIWIEADGRGSAAQAGDGAGSASC